MLGWDEPDWDFEKDPKKPRRRRNQADKDGILPIGSSHVKHSQPYSYPEFYLYRAGGKHNCAVYSDRMMQWDYDKFNRCCQEVWDNQGQYFSQRDPKEIEKFLKLYNEDPELRLVDIIEGCNRSNGYPYWVFRFNSPKLDVDPNTE